MRNILAALLTAALCLGLAACGPAPEPEPTPTPTPSVSPSPEAAEFALACYPEAGFHPITGSNRTNLALGGLLYEGLFALNGQFQPQATWLDTPGFAPCGAGRGVFPENEFPERLIFNFVSPQGGENAVR